MELDKLRKLIDIMQSYRCKHTEFTIYMLKALLIVAGTPALTQKELLKLMNVAPGNIARICSSLGDGTPKRRGLGLIVGRRSPDDWRATQYFLTNKGLLLITTIQNIR